MRPWKCSLRHWVPVMQTCSCFALLGLVIVTQCWMSLDNCYLYNFASTTSVIVQDLDFFCGADTDSQWGYSLQTDGRLKERLMSIVMRGDTWMADHWYLVYINVAIGTSVCITLRIVAGMIRLSFLCLCWVSWVYSGTSNLLVRCLHCNSVKQTGVR